jgi:hypothetical protein
MTLNAVNVCGSHAFPSRSIPTRTVRSVRPCSPSRAALQRTMLNDGPAGCGKSVEAGRYSDLGDHAVP